MAPIVYSEGVEHCRPFRVLASGPEVVLVALAMPISIVRGLPLALLVARVVTDNHDATVPANDLAVIADLLNAWLDLHSVLAFLASLLLHRLTGRGSYL